MQNRPSYLSPHSQSTAKPALITFFCCLLVTLGIGLYLRHLVYSDSLASLVARQLEKIEDFSLTAEGVKMEFSRGWLPVVALYADSMVGKDNKCPIRNLVAEKIFVSLSVLDLFRGQIVPSKVYISSLLTNLPKRCEGTVEPDRQTPAGELVDPKPINQDFPDKVFDFFAKQARLFFVRSIDIGDFQLKLINRGKNDLEIKGSLKFNRRPEGIKINIFANEIWLKQHQMPVTSGFLAVDLNQQRLTANYETQIREGKLKLNFAIDNDNSYPTTFAADIVKVPVSAFSPLFLDKTQLQYLWANCQFTGEAHFAAILQSEFSLENCGLAGPFGTASVISSQMTLQQPQRLSVEFSQLDLDQIFKSKRDIFMSGVFAKYGKFSGTLQMDHNKAWSLNSLLTDSELVFSRNNLRELQRIDRLPLAVTGDQHKIIALISGVEINEGQFAGQIKLVFNENRQHGEAVVALDSFALNRRIYKLMLDAEPTPFSVFGKIRVADQQVDQWSGVIAAKDIQTSLVNVADLKVETEKLPAEVPKFIVTASKGFFHGDSRLLAWLKPTTLAHRWPSANTHFSELSARLSRKDKLIWTWQRGYLRFDNGWQLSSEGQMQEDFLVKGWLQWDIPEKKYLRWQYDGPWEKAKWQAQESWMVEWLRSHPKFLTEHPSIEFSDSSKQADG